MRIMIKGGVWKNTEDEILKAAVMKYGLNQWARISSLLVRKSAKQCKARWYEWLDPSIKKTEWTREEDEKLLHLAKLMPTQWRTIAPIVGRTPAQCLERYEKLLDMAASKDDNYDPADDPRRLRPGEIDPNPEAKPARPDPIDMDEDEKEMLSEARARLANTRGKKAKRKSREKQLEEARRLASLQKKRELKAAGIELRQQSRRRRGIDYNREVAFEHRPAPGFYDTAGEEQRTKELGQEFRPATLEDLEGKRRKDIEAALMKRDVENSKIQQRHNQPAAVAQANALNDPALARRRGKLMLPAPQVSEAELEAIARGATVTDMDAELGEGAGGAATRRLLGDYATPQRLATPMRTPRQTTATGQDRIMMEAQNLARLQAGQTPLQGGDNPMLHPSDFSGVTPRSTAAATPNPLATPLLQAGGMTPGGGATPAGGRSIAGISATPSRTPGITGPGSTPMRTPMRDALGLNDPDALGALDDKRGERARAEHSRSELRAGLSALPQPQNDYQIMMPELPPAEDEKEAFEEDAADAEARRRAAAKAAEAAELAKRSSVLRRGLPRPTSLALLPEARPDDEGTQLPLREAAEELLNAEMALMLRHDEARYPLRKASKEQRRAPRNAAPVPEEFEPDELAAASRMLAGETEFVKAAMGHDEITLEEYTEAWATASRDLIFVPSQGRYVRAASATNSDRLASIKSEFDAVRAEMEKEAQRAAKLQQKAEVVTRGLVQREEKLRHAADEAWAQLRTTESDLACFRALAAQEAVAGPARRRQLADMVAAEREKERGLQARYKELSEQMREVQTTATVASKG